MDVIFFNTKENLVELLKGLGKFQHIINHQFIIAIPPNVFTPMQNTEIVYPINGADSSKIVISPYIREVDLPNILATGSLKFRTIYKPIESSIDSFYGPWKEVSF